MKTSIANLGLYRASLLFLYALSTMALRANAQGQLQPVNAIYYINPYLVNPAMAGKESTLKANIGYRKQLSNFGQAPQTQFLTADYGYNDKSGFGIKVFNDQAGLLRETAIAASYAYHLLFTEANQLSFGLSGSYTTQRLNGNALNGDLDDPDVADLASRKGVFDADFGLAYTSPTWNAQLVLPNMVNLLNNKQGNAVNAALFFSSVSYQLITDLGKLEPKLVFRAIRGMRNMVDLGANLELAATKASQFNVMALYHSSKNATLGAGMLLNEKFNFNASYTIGTGQMGGYTNGDFELGLGIKL